MSEMPAAHTRIQVLAGEDLKARPSRSLTLSAWAGIVGPVLFTAAFLAQDAFRRDEYDPLAEPVSALEAGPNGWVQQVNFAVFGLLTIAFAVGLHRGLRPTKAGRAAAGQLPGIPFGAVTPEHGARGRLRVASRRAWVDPASQVGNAGLPHREVWRTTVRVVRAPGLVVAAIRCRRRL